MSNTFITPNMNLALPIVGQEIGPDWASDNNNAFGLVDSHNHAPGFGVQINPNGIDINADLTWNNTNNAIALRSVRFFPQLSPIPASLPDLGCLYESGVDLYFNDGVGNQVRLTQGGTVAGASGTITGLPSGTASAAYSAGSGTFVFQQATATAANMDIGTLILRYPGSYPTPAGNFIAIEAPTSLATGYAFTLPATLPGSNGAFLTSDTLGNISYTNVDNSTLNIASSLIQIKPQGVTQGLLAPRSTGTSVGIGGIAIAASSGLFVSSSTSLVLVTNQSVTIVTTGRPVNIYLQSSSITASAAIGNFASSGAPFSTFAIQRNSTTICLHGLGVGSSIGLSVPPGTIYFTDVIAAGTYTYTLLVRNSGIGTTGENITVTDVSLVAEES